MAADEHIDLTFNLRIERGQLEQLRSLLAPLAPAVVANSPHQGSAEGLLTTDEAAGLLRISKSSLYGLRYRRIAPPAIKIGNRLRWRRLDLESWIDTQVESSEQRGW